MEPTISGVGVLDKSVAVLEAVAADRRGASLSDVVAASGLAKATAHRLARALEVHGLLRRQGDGRYLLGARLVTLGRAASDGWPLAEAARPALETLRDATGESVQLYRRDGQARVCVVSLESPHELRTIVEQGARLPLGVGSAGRVLAQAAADWRGDPPGDSTPSRTGLTWTASVAERAPGVASVSAPVLVAGVVVAAVGISGPVERLGDRPGARHGPAVVAAAAAITAAVAEVLTDAG